MHELEFDAQMIEPLMDVFGEFDPEGLIESRDVAHDVGLREDVIVAKERFVGRTVQRDDVAEHAPVFGLQFAQLPVHALGRDELFDLIELFAHQCQFLLRPIAADAVECGLQAHRARHARPPRIPRTANSPEIRRLQDRASSRTRGDRVCCG